MTTTHLSPPEPKPTTGDLMISLDISWAGRAASDYSRVFKAAAFIDNFKPVLEQIGSGVIAPSIKENFESGGRPPWLPLAESTIAKKSRQGAKDPTKILVHTGAMEQAATDPTNYQITNEELKSGPIGILYWGYHQVGDGVPKRVIMMLQAADRSAITRLLANYIRTFMTFNPRLEGARPFTGGGLP